MDINEQDPTSTPENLWRAPSAPNMWRVPENAEPQAGWRVPTLPQDLEEEPDEMGAWHLPKPQDTLYSPEDEIEITLPQEEDPDAIPPEDALPNDLFTAAREAAQASRDEDQLLSPEDQLLSSMGATAQKTAKGNEDAAPVAPEDLIYMLENLDDDDDDDGSVPMSELIALASLTEEDSSIQAIHGADSPFLAGLTEATDEDSAELEFDKLSAAEQLVLRRDEGTQSLDPNDPAAYARQQLEQLGGTGASPAVAAPGGTGADDPASYAQQQLRQLGLMDTGEAGATTEIDPAAYARQQLEQMGTGAMTGFPQPTQQQVFLTPEEEALAQKFEATQAQVQQLRQQMQFGQITQEQFLTQLRELMILDPSNVWWMMGMETDTWYKAQGDQWVQATPDVLLKKQQAQQGGFGAAGFGAGGTAPGDFTQFNPGFNDSLPYLGEQGSPATRMYNTGLEISTEGIRLDENNMPLPRQVPFNDPDATVPNAGAFMNTLPNAATTVPGQSFYDATVPSGSAYGEYSSIEAPIDETEPPDYDTLSEQQGELYESAAEKRRRSTMQTGVLVGVIALGLVFLAGAGFIAAALLWYNGLIENWRPGIAALASFDPGFATVRVLDNSGQQIATLTREGDDRRQITITQVSPYFIHAVLTLENPRFFEDPGWDFFSIMRAFYENFIAGDITSGASTITQQVARNLVLQSADATADRKLNEIIVAGEITNEYSKNEILELYFNDVTFFGNQTYGIEAAAQFYFGKPAADLNWPEAALLASIIQSPATNEPVNNRENALQLMRVVMDRMVTNGCQQVDQSGRELCITQADLASGQAAIDLARVQARRFNAREFGVRYPHFTQRVQAELESIFGASIYSDGYVVTTTLDSALQDFAQESLQRRVTELSTTGVNTGALMVTDPRNGAILAMVGSPDFNNEEINGQVNNALTWQQPGSAIKPVVYAAALTGIDFNGNGVVDLGEYYTPATILWDVPVAYGNYTPRNFDGRFRGPVSVRSALQNSYNIPAIQTYEFIGNENFISTGRAMGLDFLPEAEFNLTTAVGSTDVRLINMMNVYGTIANNGMRRQLFTIESIVDSNGNPIPIPPRAEPSRVISESVAFLLQSILSDDAARAEQFGTGSALTIGGLPTSNVVGAKTGTTDGNRDLWTMGFTSNRVVGVWLGTFNNTPTVNTTGFTAAAPLWNSVMRRALEGNSPSQFIPPTGGSVISNQICAETGTLPGNTCAVVRNEFFAARNPPPPPENGPVVTLRIDSWTGLRANDFCPDQQIESTFANIANVFAVEWLNTTAQGQAYAQRVGLTVPVVPAPQQDCSTNTLIPVARISEPAPGSIQTVQGTLNILGQISAENFNRYQVEFAPVGTQNFQIIGQPSQQQQPNANSLLATWDTSTVPNGDYTLRLAAFANNGGFLYRNAQVTVNNPVPTATPVPTQIPTQQPIPQPATVESPLPFDPVGGEFGGQSAPSGPTATIDPLGG